MRNFLLLLTMTALIFSCKKKEDCYIFTHEIESYSFSPQTGTQIVQVSYKIVEMCDINEKEAKEYVKVNTKTETIILGSNNTKSQHSVTYKIKE